MKNSLLIFSLPFFLAGCGNYYQVHVNSLLDKSALPHLNYLILPGMKDVQPNDLQFKEFAVYIQNALKTKGFVASKEAVQADVAVLLSYGTGNAVSVPYAFSLPIYGQTGGGSATYTSQSLGTNGYSVSSGRVYSPPQYGVVGTQSVAGVTNMYPMCIVIEAIDLTVFNETKTVNTLWRTTLCTSSASNDLRAAFPVMVAAGADYIGTDTKQEINIPLFEADERVERVKNPDWKPPARVSTGNRF